MSMICQEFQQGRRRSHYETQLSRHQSNGWLVERDLALCINILMCNVLKIVYINMYVYICWYVYTNHTVGPIIDINHKNPCRSHAHGSILQNSPFLSLLVFLGLVYSFSNIFILITNVLFSKRALKKTHSVDTLISV